MTATTRQVVDSMPRRSESGITVVIVAHNSTEVIGDCLRSLPAACAGTPTSIVVVDNASTDGTIEMVERVDPQATLIRLGSNRGYAAAINVGIRALREDRSAAVLVLNPDVRMGRGSLAPLLAAMERPGVGIVAPKLMDASGAILPSLRRRPTVLRALGESLLGGERAGRYRRLGEVITDRAQYAHPSDVDWATGAALLISRACLEDVGRWDESYFLYSEEVDFALRASDAGYSVRFEPSSAAVHLEGRSNTDPRLWSLLTRNRIRFYRNRYGPARGAIYGAAVLLNAVIRAVAGRPTHRAALSSLVGRRRPPSFPGTMQPGIVCFSAQDWWYFNRAHSDFQLMKRAAAQRPVLLINSLGMRMPRPGSTTRPWARVARKVASVARGLRRPLPQTPGFAVLTPFFLPVYTSGRVRDVSNRFVAWQVRRAAARHGISEYSVVVTLPTAWEVVRHLPRRALIANRSDRYSAFTEADGEWVGRLERELLGEADVAVYASTAMLRAEESLTRRPTLLDHGVDLDRFRLAAEVEQAQDIASLPRPRIGFFGAIDDYTVDVDLLERVALEFPDASVVLVGPTNRSIDRLRSVPNVHWLGSRPAEEIPSYGAGFDVALMPWLDNEWIRYCNPIKLKEYLALGLPVVTTGFPEVERYRGVVRIADDADHFIELVRRSLADAGPSSPADRRAAVEHDSWDNRVQQLLALCDGVPSDSFSWSEPCADS